MMVLCFMVAAGTLVRGVLPAADPRLASAGVTCSFWHCELDDSPLRLLPQEGGRPLLLIDAAALDGVVDRPQARILIATGALAAALPAAWMFLSLALAFRSFRRRRDLSQAVRWLRAAALGAFAGVVLRPLADTLRATALSPASTGEQQIYLMFEGGNFLWGMIITGAVLVAVRALEQSIRSEQALAEIV
jgi:hypothetical protein